MGDVEWIGRPRTRVAATPERQPPIIVGISLVARTNLFPVCTQSSATAYVNVLCDFIS